MSILCKADHLTDKMKVRLHVDSRFEFFTVMSRCTLIFWALPNEVWFQFVILKYGRINIEIKLLVTKVLCLLCFSSYSRYMETF